MKNRLLKFYVDRYLHLIPIAMILVTLLSNFIELNYVLAGNIIGYSILSNIVLWYLFNFKGNYCWFTRSIPIALILINVIDISGLYINYGIYSKIFNVAICSIILILFLLFKIKKIA